MIFVKNIKRDDYVIDRSKIAVIGIQVDFDWVDTDEFRYSAYGFVNRAYENKELLCFAGTQFDKRMNFMPKYKVYVLANELILKIADLVSEEPIGFDTVWKQDVTLYYMDKIHVEGVHLDKP